jgi:hypothetical protein
VPKATVDHGPEPAPHCATGFARGRTLRVSVPSMLAVAWAAAQPVRVVVLCNQALVGRARHCAASRVGTVQAGRAPKPAHGLSFVFLFSEFNQINTNSKICTSLI